MTSYSSSINVTLTSFWLGCFHWDFMYMFICVCLKNFLIAVEEKSCNKIKLVENWVLYKFCFNIFLIKPTESNIIVNKNVQIDGTFFVATFCPWQLLKNFLNKSYGKYFPLQNKKNEKNLTNRSRDIQTYSYFQDSCQCTGKFWNFVNSGISYDPLLTLKKLACQSILPFSDLILLA